MNRWRWRGSVALLAVALAFVLFPMLPNDDVINSDWPAFDTGARLIVHDAPHLYDFEVQQRTELEVTGGRSLVGLSIHGILPFLAPAWVALIAVPFDVLGPNLGGRLWILAELACLIAGLYLATRPRPPSAILPAFAGVPTALMMLNAQLDGIMALGIGAAIALWSRPYLAGLALGLTLVKPQLVLPLGAWLLVTRRWSLLAGWATIGVLLLAGTLALNPHWVSDWLTQIRSTVQPGAREVDLPHFALFLPTNLQTLGLVVLTIFGICDALILALRRPKERNVAVAVLVIGGVVGSPHALATDLVLISLGLAIWAEATWMEWLALSVVALAAALTPDPVPAALGVLLAFWLTMRISYSRRSKPALASAR